MSDVSQWQIFDVNLASVRCSLINITIPEAGSVWKQKQMHPFLSVFKKQERVWGLGVQFIMGESYISS